MIDTITATFRSLSHAQMQQGFAILSEVQRLLDSPTFDPNDRATHLTLMDASNRFYTVIPHHFSVRCASLAAALFTPSSPRAGVMRFLHNTDP